MVVSARVVERSDSITSSHPMIPVHCLLLRSSHARLPTQCLVRNISQLQSLQLAMLPTRSERSAIRHSSLLNCALCPRSSCTWCCPVVYAEQLPVTTEMLLTHWSVAFGSSLQHELASSADALILSCDLSPPKQSQPAV